MPSIFAYQFFQNALAASLLTAIVCGIVGAYIVVRRIVFVSGGITHASFGGIGLGIYLGINPILSAAGAAILAAFSIGKLSRTEGIREDSAIASIWALGMALGVLFMTLTPGYATSLPAHLFGNILLVTTGGLLALVALGARLLDAGGDEVDPIGSNLARIQRIETSGMDHRLRDVEVLVAGNMHNLLTGERGVARVFGPQKGASPEQVEALEAGLVHWAGLLTEAFPTQVAHRDLLTGPGTGASGGLGAGLAAGLGARLCSRFDVLMDADLCGVDLDAQIARADLVITAEGAVDFQTPRGKIPAEVGRRAKLAGKPVIALAGSIGQGSQAVHAAGIDAIMGIIPVPMDLPEAVSRADELVTDATERALRLILLGAAIAA